MLRQDGLVTDLILIGQRSSETCGWPCFIRWQKTAPHMPAMLYVLDACQASRMADLVQVVKQAPVTLARTLCTPRRTPARPSDSISGENDTDHAVIYK